MSMTSFASLPRLTPQRATLLAVVWVGLFSAMLVVSWPQMAVAQQACTLSQITHATPPYSSDLNPAMNADGTRIAFSYAGDLTPNNPGNADGSFEIFTYDTTTGSFTQITNAGATGSFTQPTMSGDGKLIAFERCCTVIVLYDTTTGSSTQLTPANPSNTQGSLGPAISADGRHLAFASTLNLTGGNPNGNSEIFTYDRH